MGRLLVGAGLVLLLVGCLVLGLQRAGLPLGRLPGDLRFGGKHFQVFFPLASSLVLSVLLSLVLYALARWRR